VKDEAVHDVVASFAAEAVAPEAIHAQDVDVFAPCALGAVINDTTLPEIRARAICGLANNQLAEPRHGEALRARSIAYVPDYVVNAGGMMGASTVIFGTPSSEASRQRILGLRDTILSVLREADTKGRPSSDVADEMARARIAAAWRWRDDAGRRATGKTVTYFIGIVR
jgi:leucine dehydrogenase